MSTSPVSGNKTYLGRPHVATRYGRCTRTVKRWKEQAILPPPDLVINGFDFWLETTLDAHDRKMTAESAAKAREVAGERVA